MNQKYKCDCHTHVGPSFCIDCDRPTFPLSKDEVHDVLSALSFFIEKYPDREGSVVTRKAMKRITKRLWKMLNEESQ